MSLSIGSEWIVVVCVGREAAVRGQLQKIVRLIHKNFDARSRNRRGAAGPACEDKTKRIDHNDCIGSLNRRHVFGGDHRPAYGTLPKPAISRQAPTEPVSG